MVCLTGWYNIGDYFINLKNGKSVPTLAGFELENMHQ